MSWSSASFKAQMWLEVASGQHMLLKSLSVYHKSHQASIVQASLMLTGLAAGDGELELGRLLAVGAPQGLGGAGFWGPGVQGSKRSAHRS